MTRPMTGLQASRRWSAVLLLTPANHLRRSIRQAERRYTGRDLVRGGALIAPAIDRIRAEGDGR